MVPSDGIRAQRVIIAGLTPLFVEQNLVFTKFSYASPAKKLRFGQWFYFRCRCLFLFFIIIFSSSRYGSLLPVTDSWRYTDGDGGFRKLQSSDVAAHLSSVCSSSSIIMDEWVVANNYGRIMFSCGAPNPGQNLLPLGLENLRARLCVELNIVVFCELNWIARTLNLVRDLVCQARIWVGLLACWDENTKCAARVGIPNILLVLETKSVVTYEFFSWLVSCKFVI